MIDIQVEGTLLYAVAHTHTESPVSSPETHVLLLLPKHLARKLSENFEVQLGSRSCIRGFRVDDRAAKLQVRELQPFLRGEGS